MNGHDFENLLTEPPSRESSGALAMLLHDLFVHAPTESLVRLANVYGTPSSIDRVKDERSPLIGLCYSTTLLEQWSTLGKIPPEELFFQWSKVSGTHHEKYRQQEHEREADLGHRFRPRPFRLRCELYTEPENAVELVERLAYDYDPAFSVYFRADDPEAEVSWNWPLRIGFLGDDESARLHDELEKYLENERFWLGDLIELVFLTSETDSCDLLLFPGTIHSAVDAASKLGIKLSADCVLVLGEASAEPRSLPLLIEELRQFISTGGVGVAPLRSSMTMDWIKQLVGELSHDEPLDAALFTACQRVGASIPFLAASRKLIEFSRLTESIKSLGEKLTNVLETAPPIEITPEDAFSFGIDPGDYPPQELGEVLSTRGDTFVFDQETRTGSSTAKVENAARDMTRGQPPRKPEARRIQARVFDLSSEKEPVQLKRAFRADAPHKAVVRIGLPDRRWFQNQVDFKSPVLSEKETYILKVVFMEPQLFKAPQVSTIELPPEGNSSECEFPFYVPKDTETIEARISIVYKNRVLQTALLRGRVATDLYESTKDRPIGIFPEAKVRREFSNLKERRNFDAAFVLNHDTNDAPGLTSIKDKYVSFSALGGLDAFVKKVDEFMTQVADYPAEYAGKLDTPKTVELLADLAKHGRILFRALAEYPDGNMADIFSALSPTDPKYIQRIQIISAKSDTRLPMEFLYDRTAPARSDAKLCPKAQDALLAGACFVDCDGRKEPANHVCPMGFWGLSKIIERHTYNPRYKEKEVDGDFRFQSEPVEGRNRLDIFKGVLFGASSKADKLEVRTPGSNTVTVQSGGIDRLLSVLDTVTGATNRKVTSWADWRTKINLDPSPTALLLLTHTEKSGTVPALEIEEGVLVEMQSIEDEYVYMKKDQSPPVVFLIGCETGAADIEFMNFVAQFRRGGAAIIVSTGAPIRGRHAVPVTSALMEELKKLSGQPSTSFGQVMTSVKRNMLAQGFPMVLTLMTYGDADWQIGK